MAKNPSDKYSNTPLHRNSCCLGSALKELQVQKGYAESVEAVCEPDWDPQHKRATYRRKPPEGMRDNGNPSSFYIWVLLGLYGDNGKENGNYNNGLMSDSDYKRGSY